MLERMFLSNNKMTPAINKSSKIWWNKLQNARTKTQELLYLIETTIPRIQRRSTNNRECENILPETKFLPEKKKRIHLSMRCGKIEPNSTKR